MRLPKESQYAVLFILYLCRAGRATTESAAEGLGVSKHFLEQIARSLRKAGIVKAWRGPKGGYSIYTEPTVRDVLKAVETRPFITGEEYLAYRQGEAEHRSFAKLTQSMNSSISDPLNRMVRSLMEETVTKEFVPMSRLDITATVN